MNTESTAKTGTFGKLIFGERIHVSDSCESFVAMAPGTERLLVLKKLKTADDPEAAERFVRLAEVARRFDHPSLCRVTENGRDYLVREFAEGKDLRAIMRRLVLQQQVLEEPLALLVAREVCSAMEHVHAAVHGDDRVTGALDARHVVLTYDGEVCLTSAIAHGDGPDPQADVDAIGDLLHEMLTGKVREGELDARVVPLVTAGRSGGVRELRAAIERQLAASRQRVTTKDIASVVKKVFARARRSEGRWRRQLSSSDMIPTPELVRTATPVESLAPAPRRSGTSPVWWLFAALVALSAALLALRGVVALRPPRGLLTVESDVPVKISIDGEGGHTSPLRRQALAPGTHRLVFTFAGGRVMRRTIQLDAKQHIDLRLRRSEE
jgi:hypothetical protein